MTAQRRTLIARIASVAALVVGVAVVAWLLVGGGTSTTIHAHFIDAGQLVKGDLVEVAAVPIGSVSDIRLTPDAQADVVLKITDPAYQHLHRGTRAIIRQVGLSGIANRFVELVPGSMPEEIGDGGVLSPEETTPIVDLDVLLDALTPSVRRNLQDIIKLGARATHGTGMDVNHALTYFDPALVQTAALAREVAYDQFALQRLIQTTADVSTSLAPRSGDITSGIVDTARTLRAVSRERGALADALQRAPATLRDAGRSLNTFSAALDSPDVRALLIEARPVAAPLSRFLRLLVPTTEQAVPVLATLRGEVPALHRVLTLLPPLDRAGSPTARDLTPTVRNLLPILHGLRPYAEDIGIGIGALGGSESQAYDANGHYARISANVSGSTPAGFFNLPAIQVPGLLRNRTHIFARCPGGGAEPAPDHSNPWIPDRSTCDPSDDLGAP